MPAVLLTLILSKPILMRRNVAATGAVEVKVTAPCDVYVAFDSIVSIRFSKSR